MDYARRRRLKILGRAGVASAVDEPELADPHYDAVVERAVLVTVAAFDWNCPQHITPRYTLTEIEPRVADLRAEMKGLEAEDAQLRRLNESSFG